MRWTLVLVAFAACGKSDSYTPPPPAPEPPAAKPPPPVVMAPQGDDGSCTVSVTGAATIDETTPASGQSKFWMSDAELGGVQQSGFLVNCKGTKLRLSFVTSPNTSVDFKAKDYTVAGRNPDVSFVGRADKSLQDFAGKVAVTGFDGHHLTGTLDLTAKQIGGGNVAIKGSFEIKCTHWGKCSR